VHAKLAHVTGWILWTRDYELAPDGLSLVQVAVAQTLADRVADEIVPGRRGHSSRAPSRDALPAYALGNARLEQSRFDEAAAAFEEASRADPGHAGTQARWAETLVWLAVQDRTDRPAVVGRAREIVDRVLSADPTFPRALAARGVLSLLVEADSARAAEDLRASLARDPDQPAARVWLAHVELAIGRPESALAEVNVAHASLPLVPHVVAERMRIALAAGAMETTIASARALLAVAPAWTIARIPLAIALERGGAVDDARAELARFLQASGAVVPAGAATAELWSRASRAARPHPFTAALAAAMAGDRLAVAGHLDRARQSRAVDMLSAPAHPILAGLPDFKRNDK
jgi:tetratricopeptide (TPR) repeat protein